MIAFTKAHAYGNDFLYVEDARVRGVGLADLARQMCARRTGVGADGLIVFEPVGGGATMRLFNADGSRAEVSGNGVRGLAALLLRGVARDEVAIRTEGGIKRLHRLGAEGTRHLFRAAMGAPQGLRQVSLSAAGEDLQAVVLSIGNPQCVVLGPLPDQERLARLGAAIERHPMFPEGTNVEFAFVERPDRVRMLIWERGCGPTQSSGTGSCAAAVASAAFGGASRDVEVAAPGGAQRVEWEADGVYLTGWAELVCEGQWLPALPPGRADPPADDR